MREYKVERNRCNCHPETCCCDPFVVTDAKGKVISTHYHEKDATSLVNILNSKLESKDD